MKYYFKYLTLIFVLCYSYNLLASFEKKEAGARELALANAVVALDNSVYAIYYNPANISSQGNFNISTNFRNYYGIPDIYQLDLILNMPFYDTQTGMAISKFGNEYYSEIQIGIGASYRLAENLFTGASIQGYALSIQSYGSSQSFGFNLGVQYDFIEQLSIGAHITNIGGATIGKLKEEIPRTFSLGFKYSFIEKGNLYFELYRDVKFEQDYRGAFEYEIYPNLQIRAGVMDNTNSYSFGIGSKFNVLNFDYAIINHTILGVSHSLALGMAL